SQNPAPAPSIAAIRTATITSGAVVATVRVSGVTAAENFISLVTPQLRGSRSDRLRDPSASAPSNTAGSSGPATTSSTGSASTTTPSVGSSSPSGASGGPSSSAANGTDAFKSATSRFGAPLRGSVGARASAATQAQASAAMGPNGIGNAAD